MKRHVLVLTLLSCGESPELASTVDPGFSQESPNGVSEAGDRFGAAMVTGYFNNDSFEDLVIGAPGEDNDAGAVFVMMGSANGLSNGFWFKQNAAGGFIEAGDEFGASLTSGDFNNDGLDDLVVGAPGEDSDSGAVFFLRGSNSGLIAANGAFHFAGGFNCGATQAGDEFGSALAAGDFNNDGFDDLAVGAPGENNDEGRVCVVKGRSGTGIAAGGGHYYSQESAALGNSEPGDRFGAALAAGRFTSGSHIDLAVGVPAEVFGERGGVVMAMFGSGNAATLASGFFTSGRLLTQGDAGEETETGDEFGAALTAGDITGDGYSDLIAGAPGEDSDRGLIFVFVGAATGPDKGYHLWQSGTVAYAASEADDDHGAALATGDLDGNGRVDLVVGAPGEEANGAPSNSGMIVEYYGSGGGIDIGYYATQEDVQGGAESEANDRFGAAIALGDFNGNGRDELAIGAPGESPGSDPAGGYVFVVERGTRRLTHGPIVGAVTDHSAKIWARGNRAGELEVARSFPPSGLQLVVGGVNISSTNDYTGVVNLGGLAADTQYTYTVRLDDQTLHSGTFRTLPAVSSPSTIRFAFAADINIAYRPYHGFDEIDALAPNFVILGGDNIYADDVPNYSNGFRQRYRETFGDPFLRSLMQERPVFMTWDDHEIVNNWYPGKDDRYAAARDAFDEWQASHNPDPAVAGELYYSFSAGEVDFFVLDTRSHRTLPGLSEVPGESMLGDVQRQALLDWLDAADGDFKFIVSSVPFSTYANTGSDSWEGYLLERDLIFDYIRDNNIEGVVFLSGDQHWSAVFEHTFDSYTTYEFMPTPMAVGVRDSELPDPAPAPVLFDLDTEHGFGFFEINTALTPAELNYSWISDEGVVLQTLALDANDIGL